MSSNFNFVVISSFLFCLINHSYGQLTINSDYGDLSQCDTMSKGDFIIWWDNDVDYSTEASQLLDSMIVFQDILTSTYSLQNPPNPGNGYFINLYIHRPGDQNDLFYPQQWGNGVGGESGGAHWTIPNDLITDYFNAAHEAVHIFQFNSNSFGFNSLNGEWFFEASAEWFALTQYPNHPSAHIASKIITRLPQVPMWLGWINYPMNYPQNWQREVHQYAMGTFLYYLTEEQNVDRTMIFDGFYLNINQTPQEYLFNQIGPDPFRNYFVDFAAHCTNDFDFLTADHNAIAEDEWMYVADQSDNNEFVLTLNDEGTNGWFRPSNTITTNGWSFNTIKLNNTENETYLFEVKGDPLGSNMDSSFFKASLVVKNTVTGTTFHNINMTSAQEGMLSLTFSPNDEEVDMIIASVPNYFEESNSIFQLFPFEARVTKESELSSAITKSPDGLNIFPTVVDDRLKISGDLEDYTFDFVDYQGRSIIKIKGNGNLMEVDVSRLSSGVHLLQINNSNGVYSSTHKIIKQ